MKKIIYTFIIFLTLISAFILTGCNKKEKDKENSLNLNNDISIMTIEKDYFNNEYTENKYLPYILKDTKKLKEIIKELNNLVVEEISQNYKVINCLYYLQFDALDLYLMEDNQLYVVKVNENLNYFYNIKEGTLPTLYNLDYKENPSYNPKNLNEIDLTQKITIKKVESEQVAELTGNKEVIDALSKISFINVKENVDFGNVTYVIMIGQTKIEIVDDTRLYFNGVKNCIIKGSFEFINSIDFNNTGWLPWV